MCYGATTSNDIGWHVVATLDVVVGCRPCSCYIQRRMQTHNLENDVLHPTTTSNDIGWHTMCHTTLDVAICVATCATCVALDTCVCYVAHVATHGTHMYPMQMNVCYTPMCATSNADTQDTCVAHTCVQCVLHTCIQCSTHMCVLHWIHVCATHVYMCVPHMYTCVCHTCVLCVLCSTCSYTWHTHVSNAAHTCVAHTCIQCSTHM